MGKILLVFFVVAVFGIAMWLHANGSDLEGTKAWLMLAGGLNSIFTVCFLYVSVKNALVFSDYYINKNGKPESDKEHREFKENVEYHALREFPVKDVLVANAGITWFSLLAGIEEANDTPERLFLVSIGIVVMALGFRFWIEVKA